ncbi:MAG TPA: zinc ribbon domain-containing protein [Candidatus Limnocylindrales bacterium]|nr:zinc ribbon domain-containing protein [Candidatus Limnocylindrales bacterium]
MNRAVKAVKSMYCLIKAWLGLPYVPLGILLLLAFSWLSRPPDVILTVALMCALPLSWMCRVQCEREQKFYKKLYLDSRRYLQSASSARARTNRMKSCPVCDRAISPEHNFCPYCGTYQKGQELLQLTQKR